MSTTAQQETYYTCKDSGLCTWWHSSGVVNQSSRIDNAAVRRSRKYTVKVSKLSVPTDFHDSFVYETIPRNGNGRIYSPWDDPESNTLDRVPLGNNEYGRIEDGVSIEIDHGINMAWTQFEYGEDVKVKVLRRDESRVESLDNVVIRPRSTSHSMSLSSDGGLEIIVPLDTKGRRFSVEFQDDLYTYRSDGNEYVDQSGEVVGTEPINALLIFASPFLPENMTPDTSGANVHTMMPGPIDKDCWGSLSVLYFPPGIYWMNSNPQDVRPKLGENHIKLDPKTYWVHFAPGAYVKGAIEYTTQEDFYATGHGVLSGEHYVYQANPETFYQGRKSDYRSLRMWSHYNLNNDENQKWFCVGPTINSPPFNTMDFFNKDPRQTTSMSVQIWDYKQVGAFYMQTDGPQVYPQSEIHDVFYHANDDAIKAYYSNVLIRRLIVWKIYNDPVIQFGWASRDVKDVVIDGLDIIHTRYRRSETYVPSAIIGASPFYTSGQEVDLTKSISMSINNLTCEGPAPALMRITPLQNYENLRISNVSFPDGLQTNRIGIGQSKIPAPEVNGPKKLKMNISISNWTIGDGADKTKVTMDNFQVHQLGQFNINEIYWGQWNIE